MFTNTSVKNRKYWPENPDPWILDFFRSWLIALHKINHYSLVFTYIIDVSHFLIVYIWKMSFLIKKTILKIFWNTYSEIPKLLNDYVSI